MLQKGDTVGVSIGRRGSLSEGGFQLDIRVSEMSRGRFSREAYQRYRPTVSVILIQAGNILLVQSSKDLTKRTWLPPQGGIGRNRTLYEALSTELSEELGHEVDADDLKDREKRGGLFTIGSYFNTRRGEELPKYIVCVAMYLDRGARIRLNDENRQHVWVGDQYELWSRMGGTRPLKLMGTCHAISAAHERRMLDWSCEDVIAQFAQAA